MPLIITVEYYDNEIIISHNDSKLILNDIINYCCDNTPLFRVIKYVDKYDDTIFNSLQVKDLLSDIVDLKNIFREEKEKLDTLDILEKLCATSLKEPHVYLKFHGD